MFSTLLKSAMTAGAATSCLLVAASSASAFSFKTNYDYNPTPNDIHLESVEIGDMITSDFALVNDVLSLDNPEYVSGNDGAASSDKQDGATQGVVEEDPTPYQVQQSLGNRYLSSIIDGEDKGIFEMELGFDSSFNTLLFWERGLNSDLGVRIVDDHNTVHEHIIYRSDFEDADYTLNTHEINNTQKVGSYGLKLSDLGVSGHYNGTVTLFTEHGFNGPDFKVVGATVPEPATVLGLTAIAGAFVASRRRKSGEAA